MKITEVGGYADQNVRAVYNFIILDRRLTF